MSFQPKRKDVKPPLSSINKRTFKDYNIKGIRTRPILLTKAKGYVDKRPTKFSEPLMTNPNPTRLLYDQQGIQNAEESKQALPALYRSLMEEKAVKESVPLKEKLDKDKQRAEIRQQNKD